MLLMLLPSGRRRNKVPKYYDDPTFNNPHSATPFDQPPRPAPPAYRGAVTTATFDSSKAPSSTVNEDALPEMPTWASAVDKHVEDDRHEDVEMEPLNAMGHPDRHGAGTPMHPGSGYSDYQPEHEALDRQIHTPRRSPAPAALAATQDPYGRRSPGIAATTPAMDPYGRRSPGPAAAFNTPPDPYGRRSPGPAAAYGTHDPYAGAPRSPGLTSPVGAAGPYDQHSAYEHQATYSSPYEDYSPANAGHSPLDAGPPAGYRGLTSPSPVAAYKPPTPTAPPRCHTLALPLLAQSSTGPGLPAPALLRLKPVSPDLRLARHVPRCLGNTTPLLSSHSPLQSTVVMTTQLEWQ
ncbi:hypothetical protein N7470_009940 [Penicillium chermesinum]|nr:hypothetical protein N7470_009940 [Penicillium chermesinum]